MEALAGQVADTDGVYVVPAFVGLGAPYWDPYARGTITGLTRGSTAAHLARATRGRHGLPDPRRRGGHDRPMPARPLAELRVDGGAAGNDRLMQFQADLLDVPVVPPAGDRDDRPGGRLPGRPGGRLLARHRRTGPPLGGRPALRARARRRRARPSLRRVAEGRRPFAGLGGARLAHVARDHRLRCARDDHHGRPGHRRRRDRCRRPAGPRPTRPAGPARGPWRCRQRHQRALPRPAPLRRPLRRQRPPRGPRVRRRERDPAAHRTAHASRTPAAGTSRRPATRTPTPPASPRPAPRPACRARSGRWTRCWPASRACTPTCTAPSPCVTRRSNRGS